MHRPTLAAIATIVLLVGCGSTAPPTASPVPITLASAVPTPSPSPSPAPSPRPTTRPMCPFEGIGTCLGELRRAGRFSSATFTPPFTYTVGESGWGNWDDWGALYLLVPPGEAPQGVDADTSEFIGVYRGLVPPAENCTGAVGDPPPDAQAMASEIADVPGLSVTDAVPVSIGGLTGVMVDISLAPDWLGTCDFRPDVPLVSLLIGTGPSDGLHHVIQADFDVRLYLLDSEEGVVTFEVVDHEGRLDLDGFDEVVRSFAFDLHAPSAGPECPNIEGGSCLGELSAGTYTTKVFDPALTYVVPDGWQNLEDTPGNFLLVPPRFDLAGVSTGGSDYIGVYTSVVAGSAECSTPPLAERPEPGVGTTPDAIAAAFVARPGLIVTTPQQVSVGGRDGVVLDILMDPTWTGSCFYSQGNPVVPLIQGAGPPGLDHSMGPGLTMRAYLLENGVGTLLIEISGTLGGSPLDDYSEIVSGFQFAR
jgi:hypothetical protein